MSDYYTQTCFEINNVSPMEAQWLTAMLSDLVGIFDDGDHPEDRDDETQALWAEVKECGYLALPYTLYDEPCRVLTVVGEDVGINALNTVLKAFLKRWNRVDTIAYTWSHRCDYSEEVGEFYGGAESVSAVESPRTRDEILNEIEAMFKEAFGELHAVIVLPSGALLSYNAGILMAGTVPYTALPASRTTAYKQAVLDLWALLEDTRDKHLAALQREAGPLQETLDALRAKKGKK